MSRLAEDFVRFVILRSSVVNFVASVQLHRLINSAARATTTPPSTHVDIEAG